MRQRPSSMRFLRRRRLTAWAGLLALAFNIFAPLFMGLPGLASPGAETIVLCTPTGFQTISIVPGEDGAPAPAPPKSTTCPFCLPLNHCGAALAADLGDFSPVIRLRRVPLPLPGVAQLENTAHRLAASPRAPPFPG